jgi:DNA-binding PadR family transcriptional regulator
MHKELHILGLLLAGPKTGYDLHRIVLAHGELFTDLKKGNVYYLLERLAEAGAVQVMAEGGARGPRRERLMYTLTDLGRARFQTLLRAVVRTYEVAHTGVEVGMVFLSYLAPADAIALLEERQRTVIERRAQMAGNMHATMHLHDQLARDHMLSLMDAELAWCQRAVERLRAAAAAAPESTAEPGCPGMRAPSDDD